VRSNIDEGRKIFQALQEADTKQEQARSADLPAAVLAFNPKNGELYGALKVINNAGHEHRRTASCPGSRSQLGRLKILSGRQLCVFWSNTRGSPGKPGGRAPPARWYWELAGLAVGSRTCSLTTGRLGGPVAQPQLAGGLPGGLFLDLRVGNLPGGRDILAPLR
jgi:hypothetical protein